MRCQSWSAGLLGLLLALAPAGWVRAADDEDALKKLAEQLVEGYEWFGEDLKAVQGKGAQERLAYLLDKGGERAWDKGKEMIADTVRDKGPEYAQAFLRQQAFKQMAAADLPLIIKAYGGVKTEAWQKLDEKMNAQVESRMFPVRAGFTAWQIKGDYIDPVVTAWAEGDASDGAKELAKIGFDKIGDAVIPGYGWAKLAAQVVIASGNLMVGWINDFKHSTVLQGIYPALKPSATPEERGELARSLVQRDANAVSQEVKARYNDFCLEGANPLCIGYVDYFKQKENEEAGRNATDGMLPEILHDVLELRRKYLEEEAKAKARYEEMERAERARTEAAFAPIKARSKEVKALVGKKLARIAEIRKTYEAARANLQQQRLAKVKADFSAQPKGGAGVSFQPLGGNELQSLQQVLGKPTLQAESSSQDRARTAQTLQAARDKDALDMAAAGQRNRDVLDQKAKQIEQEYASQMAGATDPAARQAISERRNRRMLAEVQQPRENLYKAESLYRQMIEAEENQVRDDAQASLVQQMAAVAARVDPLRMQAEAAFDSAARALKDIQQQLEALPSPADHAAVLSHAQMVSGNMRNHAVLTADEPGALSKTLGEGLERAQQALQSQLPLVDKLARQEADAVAKLRQTVAQVQAGFDGAVPLPLRYVYDWNNPNYVALEVSVKAAEGPRGAVVCCAGIRQSLQVPASGGTAQRHRDGIAQIVKFRDDLEPLLRADYAASRIITLIPKALNAFAPFIGMDMAQERDFAFEQLGTRDGAAAPGVEPAKSDAAKTLQDMQQAWAQNRGLVTTLQTHAKTRAASPTLIKYWRNDPAPFAQAIAHMALIPDKIKLYQDVLSGAAKPGGSPAERDIKKMYEAFAQAYEGKSLSTLMRFLSRDWETEDGVSRDELEQNLRNSFRVFDSIEFKLEGLTISRAGKDFAIAYTVKMTGRIRQLKSTHEEKSTVKDLVSVTADGPRIVKTSGGRIWMK